MSPLLSARIDLNKRARGLALCRDLVPLVQGALTRRPGSYFVEPVKNQSTGAWFIPFRFSSDQAYVLEFGAAYIRFYRDYGQVLDGMSAMEVVTPYALADVPDLTFTQSGDVLYLAHEGYAPRKLTRNAGGTFTLATLALLEGPFQKINADKSIIVTPSAATGSGITLTASSSIFTAEMVGELFFIEAKDAGGVVAWEASKGAAVGNIRRNDGRYYENVAGSRTGSVAPTHTEGVAYDGTSGASDGVKWEFLHAGFGWVRITSFSSGTSVTADVVSRLPGQCVTDGTYKWAKPAFYVGNYPRVVTFFQQRLGFGGTALQPDTLWLSVVGDFENFAARDKGGKIVADQAVTLTLASSEVNGLRWAAADSRGLLLGTTGAEHVISAAAQSEGFGPNNAKATPQSSWGSARVQPSRVGAATLMVEAGGRTVRELVYSFDADRYAAADLLVLASHFTEDATVVQMAFQQKPHAILWCALSDGKLLGITYNREQDVVGAHLHDLSGEVESLAVIPSPDLTRDDLWLLVKRSIDGSTVRYVEYLKPFGQEAIAQDLALFLDCALSYDGWNTDEAKTLTLSGGGSWSAGQSKTLTASGHSPFVIGDVGRRYRLRDGEGFRGQQIDVEISAYTSSTQVTVTLKGAAPAALQGVATDDWARMILEPTGLDHLEGEEIAIIVDGATHAARTVSGGGVTLDGWAARAHFGLLPPARGQTLPIEAGARDGTAQGKIKRFNQIVFRLRNSGGFMIGRTPERLYRVEPRRAADAMDRAVPLYSGDKVVLAPPGYDRDGQIYFELDQALPFTLIALMPHVKTEDRG